MPASSYCRRWPPRRAPVADDGPRWWAASAPGGSAAFGAIKASGGVGPRWGRRPTRTVRRRSAPDRKSTRLNSIHLGISYAVFCFKITLCIADFLLLDGRYGFVTVKPILFIGR